ncbi:MAG: dihydropteroate synthase, partial [Candidatus Methylomirabilales bacterium]
LLSWDEILNQAKYYQTCGADIIDVGCTPGRTADNVGEIVGRLKTEGYTVSVDTFNEEEIRQASKAGVDFLLSLNGENLHLAPELSCTPVVIPDFGAGIESLERNIAELERMGVTRYIVDPILDPINFGFTRFLHRLYEVRERHPHAEMMIGVGNLTELIDADSTGVNALMVGVMTELDIRYVLTTEVAHWTRGSVRELDRARRLMHYARTQGVLPKDIDDSLLTIKDRKVDWPTEEELRELQRRITDPNFRIMIDGKNIYVFNKDRFVKDTDIQRIFHEIADELGQHPVSHAFYLGRELAKAQIALRLGKKYIQEEDLDWGYLNHGLPGD